MIIAFSGRIGSGKDTAAKLILERESSFVVKRFAGKLKEVAELLTGIPKEKFEDQEFKKSFLGPDWNYAVPYPPPTRGFEVKPMTVRELLQMLGTDAIRNGLHPNAWVNALFADYRPGDHWLITDCRFPNEYDAVRARGGIVVRIERGERLADVHPSESALDNAAFDYWIDNNGTLEDLQGKVDFLLLDLSLTHPGY